MSWLSKGLKKIGGVIGKVAKVAQPIEKFLRPVTRGVVGLIPGGSSVLEVHRNLKNAVYDPLRRGGEEAAAVVGQVTDAIDRRVNAATAAVGSVQAAENAHYAAKQNPMVVIGVLGLLMLAVGFGRK